MDQDILGNVRDIMASAGRLFEKIIGRKSVA
jgi:hypothetical protein